VKQDMGASASQTGCSQAEPVVSTLRASHPRAFKPGTRRYTVETLAAGQPRPYADDIHHVRVTFEWVPYKKREPDEAFEFEPAPCNNEELVRARLRGLGCGFTDFVCPRNPSMDEHFRTRLDWLKQVEPHVWEFHTTSPYTD